MTPCPPAVPGGWRAAVPALLCVAGLLVGCTSTTTPTANESSPAPTAPSPVDPSATSASPTPSPTPTGRVIPAELVGMHIGGVQRGLWTSIPIGALRLWDNGTSWSQVERRPGKYDWTALEGALATAQVNGISDIVVVLGGTPRWAARKVVKADRPTPGSASPPRRLRAWDRWVRKVALRCRGRVTAYQIWNEANLPSSWRGTPKQMAALTVRAARIIERVDRRAGVIAASTTVRDRRSYRDFFPAYAKALDRAGWPVDIVAADLSPAGPDGPEARVRLAARVKATLAAAGAPADMRLWDTELIAGLAGPGRANPGTEVTGPDAAAWVARAYLDTLRIGFERAYWYVWTQTDFPPVGVQMTPGSPGSKGIEFVNAWVVFGNWEGCDEADGVIACRTVKDGRLNRIVWRDSGTSQVVVPDGVTQRCDATGACEPVVPGSAVTASTMPAVLR